MNYQMETKANTLRSYKADLKLFSTYLDNKWSVDALLNIPQTWSGLTRENLEGFMLYLIGQGYAIGSVNRAISTVRTFARRAFDAGTLPIEAYALIDTVGAIQGEDAIDFDISRLSVGVRHRRAHIGAKKATPIELSDDQAIALKHDHPDTPQGRRDALLMTLLIDLGLLPSEIARLRTPQVNLNQGLLCDVRRQEVKKRIVFTRDLDAILRRCIEAGEILKDTALIRGGTRWGTMDRNMGDRAINQRVQVLGKRILGLSNLSPNDLRHYWKR